MTIAGDPAATDPACIKSPIHARMAKFIDDALTAAVSVGSQGDKAAENFVYRRMGVTTRPVKRA